MRLIDDDCIPSEGRKETLIVPHSLKACEEDVELVPAPAAHALIPKIDLVLQNHLPIFLAAAEEDDVHVRPRLNLASPVAQCCQGRNDDKWPPLFRLCAPEFEYGNALHSTQVACLRLCGSFELKWWLT
jgi:hypothetical protein